MCEEHLVLGSSYDPERCLRIYLSTAGAPGAPIAIGHVGRHFDVQTTN